MGIFGRRRPADPASWDELWSVLRPLGGRRDPASVERWREGFAMSAPGPLEAAAAQLGHAYRLLGTEAHARAMGPGAFVGLGRPFARGRFTRVVDRVVVAGPGAVARAAADPQALASYGGDVPLLDPALEYQPDGEVSLGSELQRMIGRARLAAGGQLRAPRLGDLGALGPAFLDRGALQGWPSLRGRRPVSAFSGISDPERPWLEVDASLLDPDDGGVAALTADALGAVAPGTPEDWYSCGYRAAERIYRALGADVLKDAGASVYLEVFAPQSPTGGADGDPDEAEAIDGTRIVPTPVSQSEAATIGDEERVEVLVRAGARTLLGVPDLFDPAARATLERLAGGPSAGSPLG